MAIRILEGSQAEPISLIEAKAHLRVDDTADDTLIDGLIRAAREYCETLQGRALMVQTIQMVLDQVPGRSFEIPLPPLVSVRSIEVAYEDGTTAMVPASDYLVDTASQPGRVSLKRDADWPAEKEYAELNAFSVTFEAGYGDEGEDVPQATRQAILLLIGHWYEHREEIAAGEMMQEVPMGAKALLQMNRVQFPA